MNSLESRLQKDVIKYLTKRKIWWHRTQAQVNEFGLPDLWFLFKGKFVGLELKTKRGKATELQLRKIKSINDNGGYGAVITELDEVITIVNKIMKGELM